MPLLEVECIRKESGLVVMMGGRLDAAAAGEFDRLFEDIAGMGEMNVVLDFSRLKYISSMGLSCVLNAAKAINAKGGKFALSGLAGMVREVFQITGFASILKVFDTPEAALADA